MPEPGRRGLHDGTKREVSRTFIGTDGGKRSPRPRQVVKFRRKKSAPNGSNSQRCFGRDPSGVTLFTIMRAPTRVPSPDNDVQCSCFAPGPSHEADEFRPQPGLRPVEFGNARPCKSMVPREQGRGRNRLPWMLQRRLHFSAREFSGGSAGYHQCQGNDPEKPRRRALPSLIHKIYTGPAPILRENRCWPDYGQISRLIGRLGLQHT